MSEEEAFEKWFIDGFKGGFPTKSLDGLSYSSIRTTNLWQAWNAATAEANKRINALESEVADLKDELKINQSVALNACVSLGYIGEYLGTDESSGGHFEIIEKIKELQASNNTLREALLKVKSSNVDSANYKWITEALSKSPAQSLEQPDAELKACINVLRDALEEARYSCLPDFKDHINELLASTPAQSLAKHDDEVINKERNEIIEWIKSIYLNSEYPDIEQLINELSNLEYK